MAAPRPGVVTRIAAGPAEAAAAPPPGPARGSITVAGWTVVSRGTGLLRVVAIGAVLGPTWFANIFQSTNQVPNLTYEVMAGPVLALMIVPAVVRACAPGGSGDHRRLLEGLTGLLLCAAGVLAVVGVLASPLAAWALTAGVADPAERARGFRIAVLLLCCVAPQVPLYTVAYLGAAAQQARHRFALRGRRPRRGEPRADRGGPPAPRGAGARRGRGHRVDRAGGRARAGQYGRGRRARRAAVRRCRARRHGVPCGHGGGVATPRCVRSPPAARSVRVAALPAAGVFVLLAVASSAPGGVTVFWLAYSIGAVPTALGARAVTTAVLPELSRAAHDDEQDAFAAGWRRALGYTTFVGVPSAVLLVVLAGPIAAVLATGELRPRR